MKSALKQLVSGWMTSIREAADAWHQFWFDPVDAYCLGIIRLLTGWMLVYNLLVWGIDLQAFFGINGLQPLQTIIDFHRNDPVFSFWFYVPEHWIFAAHWTCVGIAVLFFLGVATRVTSILAFVITISYSIRVPVANFGLDQILGMLCLYLAIGPSGACLSFDRWWKQWRARSQNTEASAGRYSSARVALRLIQIHMCVIYFWAGLAKLKGDSWFTGEAMWRVLASEEYQTMDLTWMAWVPWLPYLVAHVTVIWEMTFCILIWNRKFRPWMLLIGTGMHVGIGAFLGMWTFGLVMTYAYFAFSDPAAWRVRIGWFTSRRVARTISQPPLQPNAPLTAAVVRHDDTDPTESVAVTVFPDSPQEADTRPVRIPIAESTPASAVELSIQENAVASSPNGTIEAAQTVPIPALPPEPTTTPEFRVPAMNTPTIPRSTRQARSLSPAANGGATEENTELNPETAVLLVTLSKQERTTLRRYFRQHDILCRAATTCENALTLTATIRPAAVLVAGTQMQAEDLATLLEDLEDISEAPILILASELQARYLAEIGLSAHTLLYPMSPRDIRHALHRMQFGDIGAPASTAT